MDVSKPTLILAALVAGFLVALLAPSGTEATRQNLYQVIMAPPTHPTGSLAYNSCGWHAGSCLNHTNGSAMDWGWHNGSTGDYDVRFRGWFYRSGTGYSSCCLVLSISQLYSGAGGCDEMMADLIEVQPWRVRYRMRYLHTYKAIGSVAIYVSGSGIGAWNSPTVGFMVDDKSNCPWTAHHTHEELLGVALTYYAENRTTYACCYGNGNKQNNLKSNKTHTVQFQQGH